MGCQTLDLTSFNLKTQPKVSQNQTVNQDKLIEQQINETLNELKTASTEFKTSIKEFNTQLDKLANKQITEESIDFLTPNQKLEKLRATLQKITRKDNPPQDIALTLKAIEQVIQPLETGLKPEKLRQVQEYLGFFQTRNISARYYGVFGPTTQTEITNFLNARIEDLDKQIIQIEEIVSNYVEAEFNSTDKKIAYLQKNNQELTKELEQVYDQINQLSLLIYILLFITVTEPIIWLIYQLINKVQEHNKQTDDLSDDQLKPEDLQFLEDKLHSLAEDVYQHLNNHELKLKDIIKEKKQQELAEKLANLNEENQTYLAKKEQLYHQENNGFIGSKY